jgi:hypothetical protein
MTLNILNISPLSFKNGAFPLRRTVPYNHQWRRKRSMKVQAHALDDLSSIPYLDENPHWNRERSAMARVSKEERMMLLY